MGNLVLALSANWLWISTFVRCTNFRLFGFFSRIMPYGNNHLRLQSPVMSDWSGHAQQQEASLPFFFPHRQRGWPCSVNPQETKASSDAGRRTAKRWPCALARGCPARHHEPYYCKSWLKMLSLSVSRWGFTDKLFILNNLSGRRWGFPDEWNKTQSTLHSFRCS